MVNAIGVQRASLLRCFPLLGLCVTRVTPPVSRRSSSRRNFNVSIRVRCKAHAEDRPA